MIAAAVIKREFQILIAAGWPMDEVIEFLSKSAQAGGGHNQPHHPKYLDNGRTVTRPAEFKRGQAAERN